MKIIEYVKKKILECELEDIKNFDVTQLEDTEIFEGIKHALEIKSNWDTFGPVTTKLISTTVSMDMLEDGKVYPAIRFFISVNHDGVTGGGMIYIDPFKCYRVDHHYAYERTAKKNLSNAVSQFMASKFGDAYIERHTEYFDTVKRLKVERAKTEADEKIKEAEEEYKEHVFSF